MIQAAPEASSATDILVKDLGIVLEAGRETKARYRFRHSPTSSSLGRRGRGAGKADDSQVIRTYDAMNGSS